MVPTSFRSLLVAFAVSLLSVPGTTWAGAASGCPVEFTCEQGVCESGSCECSDGWTGVTCGDDIDECATGPVCPANAVCVNLPGSFQCQCPADAKQCPDGSFVGRELPECEFAPCPPTPSPTPTEEPVFCTADVMQCPDGTFVGREPPNCEFAPCPPTPSPTPTEEPVFCTADAKQCPDGSFVGRVPPECEFAPCPPTPTPTSTPVQCTDDVKQCPDGSFVGRFPPECEFAPCPPTPTPTSTPPACTDDVKVCPDGTVLSRDPVTCLFPECPTVPLSHFQCYDVRRVKFDDRGVDLTDELGPGMTEVRRPKTLCAPVNKNGEDPTAPAEPDHLLGYEIRRAAPAFRGIKDFVVEDQFGPLVVDLRRPDRLLVPTAKSLTGPATPLAPAMVDHYQCYAVQGARRRSSGVEVEDQFGMGTTDVKKPLRLCLPVDKQGEGILDPAARLMCYRIKTGPRVNRDVWVDNQFGAGVLEVRRARELCVPVVRPEPDTLPTPTPTPTPDAPCCDPATEPGANGNPLCIEGHACCPDGTWACSIGDGLTFPCGGELTQGPFGERCEACCDPADEPGTDGNPFCFEGHACCPDGTWACSIGDGLTFPCDGDLTQGPFGEVCTDP